ncbi:hypothetical protein [Metallibacterium sp.]|uniref:hypothetical protein n=1 Tax=Metallibacterium sp. TaxID=2940281 RepID=UPI002635FD80|nr:hypothetical protein [Metallibacterium sp.]
MKALWRWLALPWYSSERVLRRFTLIIQALLIMGALLARWLVTPGDGGLLMTLMPVAAASAFAWMSIGQRWLLVTRDTHALRLPRARRRIILALASLATQTLLLPTLLLVLLGLPAAASLMMLLALSVLVLLWGLAPRWLVPPLSLVPTALILLADPAGWPAPTDPGFALLGAQLAALGLCIVALRWRALMHIEETAFGRWSVPMVFLLRGQQGLLAPSACAWSASSGTLSVAGLHALRGADPSQPVRKLDLSAVLRVFLGPPFAPHGRNARLRAWLAGLAIAVALEALLWWALPQPLPRLLNAVALAWTALMGWLFVLQFGGMRLTALFARGQAADLALLAHLPGLGTPQVCRSALLRVTLRVTAGRMLVAGGLLLALWWLLVGAPAAAPILAVMMLFYALAATTWTLAALSGRSIQGLKPAVIARLALLMVLLCAVLVASGWLLLPTMAALARKPGPDSAIMPIVRVLVALGWAGAFAWMLAALRRNGRAFQRRPHPFLQR